ncbi:alpha/beta hydrolase [Rhodococcus sp. X156]|uniref:alpha/beta fold hydrolase n=1 Tax=Rhodococcus sp. X156 TaxID=2499145 RepID=UPI000FD74B7C|nr:alpha/beta hydrolase [Rhodococcus sp. X156]
MVIKRSRGATSDGSSTAHPGESLHFYSVRSGDGTVVEAWTNDADGPTVLLANGLGTNPHVWPSLLRKDCGVRVISWNHRGIGGSERPADRERVGVDTFVEDALAVLDDAGVESAVVLGWSIGVNTAFELAVRFPERVRGIVAVAGVPGGTFHAMGAPLRIPRFARQPVARAVARTLQTVGPAVSPVLRQLRLGPLATKALQHSGFMLPGADPAVVRRAVHTYLETPLQWGMHLARSADEHTRVSLSKVAVPTVFIAGTHDVLASAKDMRSAANRIPGAQYVELNASHFIPMERPDTVLRHLREVVELTEAERSTG